MIGFIFWLEMSTVDYRQVVKVTEGVYYDLFWLLRRLPWSGQIYYRRGNLLGVLDKKEMLRFIVQEKINKFITE